MSNAYQTPESNLVKENLAIGEYGSVEKAISGDYDFSIGTIISEAWAKTSGSKWTIHMSFLLYIIVMFVLMMAIGMVTANFVMVGDVGGVPGEVPGDMIFMQIIIQLGMNLIILPMVMGLLMIGVRRSVDAPIKATMVFRYFSKMIQLFVTMVLMYLLVIIGFILLVLPGIYLLVAYYMALPLVVEKGMSPWRALETSRKSVTHHWFSFTGLFIVFMIILTVSMIPLGIGLIWTLPMMVIAYGIVYRNMFGVEAETIAD